MGRFEFQMHRGTQFQNACQGCKADQRQVSSLPIRIFILSYSHYLFDYRIVVVLENRTYIYNFEELRLIDAIETCPNSRGLVALNPDPENTVLASPDVQKGYVRLNVYEKNKSFKVPAHQAALSAICLNFAGTLLATASEKGTLIRIFSTETGQPLQELRRGKEKADVYSICFDKKS
jgi:WD40 repeat protein